MVPSQGIVAWGLIAAALLLWLIVGGLTLLELWQTRRARRITCESSPRHRRAGTHPVQASLPSTRTTHQHLSLECDKRRQL